MGKLTFSFRITNADGSLAGFDISDYKISKYFDKYGKLNLDCTPGASVSEDSTIEASYHGTVRFRGYIDFPEIDTSGKTKITAYEQQRLLNFRACQVYNYPAGTTVEEMLTSDTPGSVVGLLYFANSLIPQGSFSNSSGYIYYLKDYNGNGGGTSSRFGALSSLYQGASLLTKVGSVGAMYAGSWYQDTTDLYVWTTDNKDPAYWNISTPNWKDTLLRIGNIESGVASETFSVPYRLGKNPIDKELYAIIDAFGIEYQWRHDNDGYTYLDIKNVIGRGSSTKGVSAYKQNYNIYDMDRQVTGDPRIHALLGAGAGNGSAQQTSTSLDLYGSGTWKEELYTDSRLFKSQLSETIDKIFPDRLDGTSYTLNVELDPALNCGDYIDIFQNKYNTVTQRVKRITYKANGSMDIEAGRRLLTPSDTYKDKFDLLNIFNQSANNYLSSWNFHFNNDAISDSVPYTVNFSVETDEIDSEFDYRFLLNVTLGWYKSSVTSVTTAAHGHSGVTGSGGSSAHGTAGTGGTHYHTVSGTTTGLPTAYSRVLNADQPILVQSAGSHSHSVSSHSHYQTAHGAYTTYVSGHQHQYNSSYGNYTGSSSPGTSSAGSHSHTITAYAIWVASDAHDHSISGYTTGTHAGHADHAVTDNPSHNLPMVTQNQELAITEQYPTLESTGSIRYIDVTIKCNGTQVTGSPFVDYYPGDSINSIDITNLINVGAENELEITIEETASGGNSVKCSLSGSVSSKYYITDI